jgi:hypothetical protein
MRSSVKQMVFMLALSVAVTVPQAAHAGAKEEARKHYDRAIELIDDAHPPLCRSKLPILWISCKNLSDAFPDTTGWPSTTRRRLQRSGVDFNHARTVDNDAGRRPARTR